jgi:aryl-alcohol dehydrogenase-like predicted oxidoreductase
MERVNGIPTRMRGSTGLRVKSIGLGGYHIGRHADAEVGVRIVRAWQPMSDEEQQRALQRVAPWAAEGQPEYYKVD